MSYIGRKAALHTLQGGNVLQRHLPERALEGSQTCLHSSDVMGASEEVFAMGPWRGSDGDPAKYVGVLKYWEPDIGVSQWAVGEGALEGLQTHGRSIEGQLL
jgi:hypothetical protein